MMWKLTNLPVENDAITILQSSPPLIINELFKADVTHSTVAVCSLQAGASYTVE